MDVHTESRADQSSLLYVKENAMSASTHRCYTCFIPAAILLISALLPGQANAFVRPPEHLRPGCTTFYGYDGQNALAGNNEDFINPLIYAWFIPASPGRFGRVYFGYDDYIPQGGLNDQGVFFDGEGLPYKPMPVTSQRPHFPGGDLALVDEVMSRSANIQDVIATGSRWNHPAGEYSQSFFGDRFGDSVIIDGDRILRKQGSFQIATNFRLVDHPNSPWPEGEERYGIVEDMLSQADGYSVDLFRRALDAAHQEGYSPTLYSQVYELNTGTIHLYLYHDFEHEAVLNLAEELAKGPHIVTIQSLFPPNRDFNRWADQQVSQWKAGYEEMIEPSIPPGSQGWMSGRYDVLQESETGPVKIYLERNQLYMQRPNQLPIELYPAAPDTVFHHFLNGFDLTLTFQRNLWGQVTGAQGMFGFEPYNISLPYDLTGPGVPSYKASLWITFVAAVVFMIPLAFLRFVRRKRKGTSEVHRPRF
jgi:hypothetical protein